MLNVDASKNINVCFFVIAMNKRKIVESREVNWRRDFTSYNSFTIIQTSNWI